MHVLGALSRRSSRTLAEAAVEALAAPIRSGKLKPGEKLPTESVIMQQLGVSRTVVREAISRLQASGLVETRHGIGTFVIDPADTPMHIPISAVTSVIDALALLELREAVEVEAAMLAAQRRRPEQLEAIRQALDTLQAIQADPTSEPQQAIDADYNFHRALAQATDNPYFLEFLTHLGRAAIPRSRLAMDGNAQRRYLQTLNREHERLYRAIEAQDAQAASAAAREHLSKSRQRLERALKAQSNTAAAQLRPDALQTAAQKQPRPHTDTK